MIFHTQFENFGSTNEIIFIFNPNMDKLCINFWTSECIIQAINIQDSFISSTKRITKDSTKRITKDVTEL